MAGEAKNKIPHRMEDAMPDDGQLAIGDVLDSKYVIEGLIGRGGMGAVYRARHVRLDSPRAIKLMCTELARDEAFVRRFENEAVLAEGVRHPNVVSLYDFASLPDGTKYIVWELVEGDTIADLLAAGVTFTPAEVAELIGQAADGLAAAHAQGIFHRDVSPDNLMICSTSDGERNVKVLDFGVAKAPGTPRATASTTGMVFGKAGYASPEQMGLLEGDASLDARTDVFSLAAVAYTMLTGKPPFVTSNMRSFLHDLMIAPEAEVQGRYLKHLEAPWRGPLGRALARDREQRPPSMEAFAADIARGAVAPETPSPARARRFRLVAPVAVALLLGTTALVTTLVPPEEPDLEVPPPSPIREPIDPPPLTVLPTIVLPPQPADEPFELTEELIKMFELPESPEPPPLPPLPPPPLNVLPPIILPPRPADEPFELTEELIKMLELPESPEPPPLPPLPTWPHKLRHVPPRYPSMARSRGVEGDVVLEGTITANGDVTKLVVLVSIPMLDQAAIDAARQWKYTPATRNGSPVATKATFCVSFEMR